jgi:hypothetical protein
VDDVCDVLRLAAARVAILRRGGEDVIRDAMVDVTGIKVTANVVEKRLRTGRSVLVVLWS